MPQSNNAGPAIQSPRAQPLDHNCTVGFTESILFQSLGKRLSKFCVCVEQLKSSLSPDQLCCKVGCQLRYLLGGHADGVIQRALGERVQPGHMCHFFRA